MSDDRRDVSKTAGGKSKGPPKKRFRKWDQVHNRAICSYRLTVEIKESIRDIARELGISPAVVAGTFLQHGIDEYRAGRIDVDVEKTPQSSN